MPDDNKMNLVRMGDHRNEMAPWPTDDDNPVINGNIVAVWNDLGLAVNKNGIPIANLDNAMAVLEEHPGIKGRVWYDEFLQRILTSKHGIPRQWDDNDDIQLLKFMQRNLGLAQMSKDNVRMAVLGVARQNKRNCVQEYIKSLSWDGVARIDGFLHTHMGACENEYTLHISKNFWISMVARAMRPGCQVDNMLILEGHQGTLKSSALAAIGGDWFMETHESPTSKDFFISLRGKLIVEMGELATFSRAEENVMKRIITCRSDCYREPWGTHAIDHPRTCIFTGSTNSKSYLRDATGGRRYWPVACGKIDLSKIQEDRDQLFAEAYVKFKDGATWWLVPESGAEEQEARRIEDAWETALEETLADPAYSQGSLFEGRYTIKKLAKDALDIDAGDLTKADQMRIADCLRTLGYERIRSNGKAFWVKAQN